MAPAVWDHAALSAQKLTKKHQMRHGPNANRAASTLPTMRRRAPHGVVTHQTIRGRCTMVTTVPHTGHATFSVP